VHQLEESGYLAHLAPSCGQLKINEVRHQPREILQAIVEAPSQLVGGCGRPQLGNDERQPIFDEMTVGGGQRQR
jgi:hypothetical protein